MVVRVAVHSKELLHWAHELELLQLITGESSKDCLGDVQDASLQIERCIDSLHDCDMGRSS